MMTSQKVLLKIIILGDSGVGKTALLHKYVMNKFIEQHKATIGADFLTKDISIGQKLITLQIWDTAGQERFQSLGNAFYRGADACVLVYDLTKPDTFDKIEQWKTNFLEQSATEYPDKFPFLLLGNKYDLSSDQRAVSEDAARQYAQQNNMLFFETSAVNGHNIEQSIRSIADIASEMDTAPIFNTETIKHENFEEFDQNNDDGDEQQTSGSQQNACCQFF